MKKRENSPAIHRPFSLDFVSNPSVPALCVPEEKLNATCLSDCRSRSCSSDPDLNSHKAALWLFVPFLLPSQPCAVTGMGFAHLKLSGSGPWLFFGIPGQVFSSLQGGTCVECTCLLTGVGGDQLSELGLGGTGTKGLCAGGNSAGHEACCERFWLDLTE